MSPVREQAAIAPAACPRCGSDRIEGGVDCECLLCGAEFPRSKAEKAFAAWWRNTILKGVLPDNDVELEEVDRTFGEK